MSDFFPGARSDSYETMVRVVALTVASRVAAGHVGENTTATSAANYMMWLVERFETYLNTGRTKP